MITIKENVYIRDYTFRMYTKKTFTCFCCKDDIIFFDVSPMVCVKCETWLINVTKLLNDKEYRAKFHIGATTG